MRNSFRLPGIEELNKSQRMAIDTDSDGQHLTVGGPGTGKSVIAMIRLRNLLTKDKNVIFLAYNHTLQEYSRQLCQQYGIDNHCVQGYIGWLKSNLKNWFLEIDWKKVRNNEIESIDNYDYSYLSQLPRKSFLADDTYLIIDEGQDMPPEFYDVLANVGYQNFFVAADQNQAITSRNSSRKDIEAALALSPTETIELTHNYRNTRNIALVAKYFYTDDPASPAIELPENRESSYQKPILYHYQNRNSVFKKILQKYDQNIDRLIGVIVPNNAIRNDFINGLRSVSPDELDHPIPKIQSYASGSDYDEINWSEGGIVVVNEASCKGLEFDVVYIADVDAHWVHGKDDERAKMMKKFYVMSSRAREELYLFRNDCAEKKPVIEQILPIDGKDEDGNDIIKEEVI